MPLTRYILYMILTAVAVVAMLTQAGDGVTLTLAGALIVATALIVFSRPRDGGGRFM